jgi:hypothetical protein
LKFEKPVRPQTKKTPAGIAGGKYYVIAQGLPPMRLILHDPSRLLPWHQWREASGKALRIFQQSP